MVHKTELVGAGKGGCEKLFRADKEVGEITSSVYSPRVETSVALGYVRRGSHEAGTVLEVDTAAGRLPAEVASLPFGAS